MRREPQNTYRVSVEPNQAGRFTARVEASYAESGWKLRVFFQAATPERVLSRLPAVLRFLQGRKEQLWLWGSDASDRGLLFQELLGEAGLTLDHRREFPRAAATVSVVPGASFRPLQLAELKRKLAARLEATGRAARRAPELARASA